MTDINSLANAQTGGTKLPFLSVGKNGCRYGLKLLKASQWEMKKSPNLPKGDWRAQFQVEVIFAEGEGHTPIGSVCGILILEDKKFGTYHLQDFRKVSEAIFGKNPYDAVNIKKLIETGEYNGTHFLAQLAPNPKSPNFPITSYFAMPEEVAKEETAPKTE